MKDFTGSVKIRAISLTLPLTLLRQPDRVQTATVGLITVIALLVLGSVLAYWTWAWFGPRPEVRTQTMATPTGRIDSASNIFGQIARAVPMAGGTIRLIGVIAASGDGSGYALLSFSGQPVRSVKEGAEVAPGITLSKVGPGEVVIDRGGVTETVALPEKKNTSPATAALR